MPPVIEVRGLGKQYQLGEGAGASTLAESVVRRLTGRQATERPTLWALQDIELDVAEGEATGMIGGNGAGKSTLLKVLARITRPTLGSVRIRGRVGALLEVGTAFHHELTGRENIMINGALLGMTRRDLRARFDEIVEFSGVGAFLDTPIKRYSSGMYLRLAFSVAAHFEPDIIVVDEVLAVGDAEFQRRCLGKMSELSGEGRTVVFVSHDLGAIQRLCDRVVWLDHGRIRDQGPAASIVDRYLHTTVPHASSAALDVDAQADASFVEVSLQADGEQPDMVRRGDGVSVRLVVETRQTLQSGEVAVWVRNADGLRVLDEALLDDGTLAGVIDRPGRHAIVLELPGVLPAGEYVLGAWLGSAVGEIFDGDLLRFDVRPRAGDRSEMLTRPRDASPTVRWHVTSERPELRR
jgi:ABC-type polysaccharide/polyol phosphate transport system ATPase subunit